jgi:hypothetical protein
VKIQSKDFEVHDIIFFKHICSCIYRCNLRYSESDMFEDTIDNTKRILSFY